jgi:hypothetical protein
MCNPDNDSISGFKNVVHLSFDFREGGEASLQKAPHASYPVENPLWPVDDAIGMKQFVEKPDLATIQLDFNKAGKQKEKS